MTKYHTTNLKTRIRLVGGPYHPKQHFLNIDFWLPLLEELEVGEVVWTKSSKTSPPWPAIVIDPREHAPEVVYFSHSTNGNKDYGWVKAGMIFPFLDNVDRYAANCHILWMVTEHAKAVEESFLISTYG
ncbi:Histone-lysine N-methyltransferase ATX4 [Carex littledalei]|uniref:Histone-lysine N-methyltransferase ATX4 n=1 Tax=Carex littledalei TaxID=544730 RepID=A0A833QY44_9POAL|nr:Histone-lysine N-methyltransferase ATX4 [Carex littledalei]